MWEYEFSKESIKALEKFDKKTTSLIKRKIKNIGNWLDDEAVLRVDIKELKGEWEGFYRLRVGRIRVLFSIDKRNSLIKVHDIGFRGNVYK